MAEKQRGPYWVFPEKLSEEEQRMCGRMKRVGRFFAFLRGVRGKLFCEEFQRELAEMYSDSPRGTPPLPPALLAMVTLLQAYGQVSDAGAVENAVYDRRWQMVLGCLGAEKAPFSQGSLVVVSHKDAARGWPGSCHHGFGPRRGDLG